MMSFISRWYRLLRQGAAWSIKGNAHAVPERLDQRRFLCWTRKSPTQIVFAGESCRPHRSTAAVPESPIGAKCPSVGDLSPDLGSIQTTDD
ncbi:hypothetical protein [Stieleria maiorica]|uniref:hypothetical protein n=1 Tax=Stieleria maiorica TaxID=2795974 RepID=UPI0011CA6F85|nr:hypothetical protein [Stieleria maiorica]